MQEKGEKLITVKAHISAPVEKVWELWTGTHHILHWNQASDDWHTTMAQNDLRPGGRFMSRMEAKNGSSGFDFTGEYKKVTQNKLIEYIMDDGRIACVEFSGDQDKTLVTESFEAEDLNPAEMQREGWQSILNNFKKYAESADKHDVLHFEIEVKSPAENVYNTMIGEKTYRQWTSVFNATSTVSGSWEKGSKILFLGTDNDGNTAGMVSRIRENVPAAFLSIEHLGVIKDGKEIYSGEEVDSWKGALENYTFTRMNSKTLLSVDIDSNKEFRSYFENTWPVALEKLKSLCI